MHFHIWLQLIIITFAICKSVFPLKTVLSFLEQALNHPWFVLLPIEYYLQDILALTFFVFSLELGVPTFTNFSRLPSKVERNILFCMSLLIIKENVLPKNTSFFVKSTTGSSTNLHGFYSILFFFWKENSKNFLLTSYLNQKFFFE